uniref:Sushi domain-containing protein n=1 Tax=Aquila chrysaetos chrysaetos TaxID=223781 RepID=A0A663F7R3_AQUCH
DLHFFLVLHCSKPAEIAHGSLSSPAKVFFTPGTSVSYICDCNPGYSLIGNAFINCTVSGTWSQPHPQCKGVFVLKVQGVKKAIKGNTYPSGTNITLECESGYTLEGISQIQCQEDFSWDPPVPACKLSDYQTPLNEIMEQKCSSANLSCSNIVIQVENSFPSIFW